MPEQTNEDIAKMLGQVHQALNKLLIQGEQTEFFSNIKAAVGQICTMLASPKTQTSAAPTEPKDAAPSA